VYNSTTKSKGNNSVYTYSKTILGITTSNNDSLSGTKGNNPV
jgi:hypothetical protein